MADDIALTSDAIAAMSPKEATDALVAKAAQFHASQAGPAPPSGSTMAARAALTAKTADPEWSRRFFQGDQAARAEFAELTGKVAAGDPTADALAGAPTTEFEVTAGLEMNSRNRADAVAGLRELGMPDEVITQQIEGGEVGLPELTMARMAKSARLSDSAWVQRFMAGDLAAKREMTLINTIIAGAPE
jgi:hypothetical protein